MLHEFLNEHHDELATRCRAKAAQRAAPAAGIGAFEHGVPRLIDQLISTLRAELERGSDAERARVSLDIGATAAKHGGELQHDGFSVGAVVHDYGDLCQALTELAHEKSAPISVDEFHTFNRCLDSAIADAVSEYGRQRERAASQVGTETMNERLGCLAHELRNHLNTSMLAFEMLKAGTVTLTGATGAVLGRSLIGLRDLIDRSLADVRLTEGLTTRSESIAIVELLDEVRVAAAMDANARGIAFTVAPCDNGIWVAADRQMIAAAMGNLLQNAFKFTRPHGLVTLTARQTAERVVIDVEDECGGLPPGRSEALFQPFLQRSADRSGVGLGLSISRRGVEANGGTLRVRNRAGVGCVFTIELPAVRPPVA